jgi:hypothetical protein
MNGIYFYTLPHLSVKQNFPIIAHETALISRMGLFYRLLLYFTYNSYAYMNLNKRFCNYKRKVVTFCAEWAHFKKLGDARSI